MVGSDVTSLLARKAVQGMSILAVLFVFQTFKAAQSQCITSKVSGFSIREFNVSSRSAVISSTDCFTNSNKTYQLTLDTPRAIKTLDVGIGNVLLTNIIYAYNASQWIEYKGTATKPSSNTIEYEPPIFLNHLVFSLGPSSDGKQCLNASLKACNDDITPAVSFQTAGDSVFFDSVNVVCNIQGQPFFDIIWQTTDGFLFAPKYIENRFSSSSASHSSTLKLMKDSLAKDGFRCKRNPPPCMSIVCTARYPGSTRSSSVSKNVDVFPLSPENFHIESARPKSAVATWMKPVKDYVMNYTTFGIALTSNQGPRRDNIPANDLNTKNFRHVIANLVPCTFYALEISAVNYQGESVWAKSNFTTTAGLLGVNIMIQNVTAFSVQTSWAIEEQFGDNCMINNASSFILSYRCVQGLSDLNSCRHWQQINASREARNAVIRSLNPATHYQVYITALTSRDDFNVTSNVMNFTSYNARPNAAPRNLQASAINESAIELSWEGIKKEQQHGKILYYWLSLYEKTSLILLKNFSGEAANASIMAGLQKCTEYTFSLSACNSAGCGPIVNESERTSDGRIEASLSLAIKLDETNPYNLSAHVAAMGNLSLENCLTGYVIQFKEMNADNWTEIHKRDVNTSTTVYALKPVTTYTFRARLIGHSSAGNWTDVVIIETDEGIPTAVRNLQAIVLNFDAIDIKWDTPLQPNGVVLYFGVEVRGVRSYNISFKEQIHMNISNQTQGRIRDLSPATLYNISIHASNRKYDGVKGYVQYETEALPPLQPPPLIIDEATSIFSNVMVTAKAIPSANGPVTGYQVIVEQRDSNQAPVNLTKTVPSYNEARSRNLSYYLAKSIDHFNGVTSFFIGDGKISPGLMNAPLYQRRNYTIHIRAFTKWKGKTLCSSTSSAYLNRFPVKDKPVVSVGMQTLSSFTIKLVQMDSKVQYMRIIVRKADPGRTIQISHPDEYADSNITIYSVSKRNHFTLPYAAAELNRRYFETFEDFVVGDGKQTNRSVTRKRRNISTRNITTFFNGPLDPGSIYMVFFRAYHTDDVYFSSDWSSPIATKYWPKKLEAPKGLAVGLIIGIIICVIAVPFFVVIGFVLWKRNKKAFEANYRFSTMELVKNGGSSHNMRFSEEVFDPEEIGNGADSLPPYKLVYEVDATHSPIAVTDFSDYYDAMKEKDYAFEDEFNELDDSSSKEKGEGKKKINVSFNRDPDAVALDDARVFLEREKKGASDYINAAFIDSYSMQNAYIATQAPLKETIRDFWDMVLQHNIRTIVMLTHVLDDDRLNTPDYWPTSVKLVFSSGELVVESKDNVFDDCAVVRGFVLSGKKKAPRIVRHFQFNKWPERGIPSSIKDLLNFRDLVNQWHKGKNTPKVIHCSNGSGRTGTYIALDAILNNIASSKIVDVFNYVNYARSRRTKMVETDRQYEFIYEVINELLNKVDRNTEMTKRNAKELYRSLVAVDPLTGCTGFHKLFKNLTRGLKTESSLVKKLEGSKAINEYKNRYSFKVPHDSFRVRLPVFGSTKANSSDYINASFVSLSDSSRFITTQAPFGITINDFWTMVHFSKADIIVSLNDLDEGSVLFTQYWPGSETSSVAYGNFKVCLELETTPFPCVIQRDFTLSELANPSETKEVTQFQVLGWEDHSIPSSRIAILQLCRHLVNDWMSEERPPLIIQCSDGFGRSGTFCICLETIKRLKNDGIADIQTIARKFKERNKCFVENEAQFKLIFDIALDFAGRK